MKTLSLDEVKERIGNGQNKFYDTLTNRICEIRGYDFDDGCCGYGWIFDEDSNDYDSLESFDLSCLSEIPNNHKEIYNDINSKVVDSIRTSYLVKLAYRVKEDFKQFNERMDSLLYDDLKRLIAVYASLPDNEFYKLDYMEYDSIVDSVIYQVGKELS